MSLAGKNHRKLKFPIIQEKSIIMYLLTDKGMMFTDSKNYHNHFIVTPLYDFLDILKIC